MILPGGHGISPITDRAVTDLPDPLSPTTARVSPASTSHDTPSTARTTRPCVKKWVCKSLISSSFVPKASRLLCSPDALRPGWGALLNPAPRPTAFLREIIRRQGRDELLQQVPLHHDMHPHRVAGVVRITYK